MNGEIQRITNQGRTLFTLSFMVGLMAIYLVIGWFPIDSGEPILLPTAIDDWVSFSVVWLPLYLFMLPISWAPACTFVDKRCLKRWAFSVVLMYLIAFPLWLFWPVTVPREAVVVDGYWTFALSVLRAVDPPVNCLPSMHVAVATLAGLLIRRVDPLVGRILLILMPFIWYSTMALDQHWFVDGLVGMIIAVGVEAGTHRWMPIPKAAQVALDRRCHLAWVGPYFAVIIAVWIYWALFV